MSVSPTRTNSSVVEAVSWTFIVPGVPSCSSSWPDPGFKASSVRPYSSASCVSSAHPRVPAPVATRRVDAAATPVCTRRT
ncbi:MAG: hypothetical protein QM820_25355 [Minicystis sp.]